MSLWRHQNINVFVMTSSKFKCFYNDVIKNRSFFVMTSSKKKEKKHFLCVFLLMTSSQYIYMYYVKDSAPILEKFLGLKKHKLWQPFSRFPFKILKWEFYRLIGFSMRIRMTCRMTSYDVTWKNRFSRFSRDVRG